MKMKVNMARRTVLHILLLGMLLVSVFGTMFHTKDDRWCDAVTISVVVSSFLPLIVFGSAVFFYAERFWDPEVSIVVLLELTQSKVGLIYLLIAMIIRVLYFLISSVRDLDFGGEYLC